MLYKCIIIIIVSSLTKSTTITVVMMMLLFTVSNCESDADVCGRFESWAGAWTPRRLLVLTWRCMWVC